MQFEQVEFLSSELGRTLLGDVQRDLGQGEDRLRLLKRLRKTVAADLAAALVQQAELRRRARTKFSLADQMLFTDLGLQQASSESLAVYKSRRFDSQRPVEDWCCGIGGDAIGLAENCQDNPGRYRFHKRANGAAQPERVRIASGRSR